MTKMTMQIDDKGIRFLKEQEGCRLTAYRCSAGKLTIGYGHTGEDVHEGLTISVGEAECIFRDDLKIYERCVNDTITRDINQCQFNALVSFVYNVGQNAFKKSTLAKKINKDPNDRLLYMEFYKWVYAGSRKIKGLANRRKAEYNLYIGR